MSASIAGETVLKMRALFFDTETTGLPKDRKKDATMGPDNWPEPVSIAWIITDGAKAVRAKYSIIQPNGWNIPEESVRIHGISQQLAMREGLPLVHVLGDFLRDLRSVDVVIAHNLEFDKNVIFSAAIHLCKDDLAIFWPKYEFCTCESAREITKIPLSKPTMYFKFKTPKLTEFYEYTFSSKPPESILHTSLGDVQVLVAIFFKHWTLEKVCQNNLKRMKSHLQEITSVAPEVV